MNIQGKKITHKNKHFKNSVSFHKTNEGDFLYFSETYNKWMPSEFTPIANLAEV